MLRVKTYVGHSKIEGFGLFAAEPISKGTVIWTWQEGFDVIISNNTMLQLPLSAIEFIKRYGVLQSDSMYIPIDDARYINHSKSPNIYVNPSMAYTTAARDIEKDEELTEDYSTYDVEFDSYGKDFV